MKFPHHSISKSYDHASYFLFALIVGFILFLFKDFGVSWDEPTHHRYGEAVLKYYLSGFSDKTAFHMGDSHYYGALLDLLCAMATRVFRPWLNEMETRHLVTAVFGFWGLWGVWRLGRFLGGASVGFWSLLLLALYPYYFSHTFNNSNDLPFAAGYVWAIYFSIQALRQFPQLPKHLIWKLGLSIGAAISIRVGGYLIFCYLALFIILLSRRRYLRVGIVEAKSFLKGSLKSYFKILGVTYLFILVFWPWLHGNPLFRPFTALAKMSKFPWLHDVLFEGGYILPANPPKYYLLKHIAIQSPELYLLLFGLFLIFGVLYLLSNGKKVDWMGPWAFLLFSILFPLSYITLSGSVLYDGFRHILFLIPCLVVLCGFALHWLLDRFCLRAWVRAGLFIVLFLYLVNHSRTLAALHPYQYTYYNSLVGGLPGAEGKYETDFWAESFGELIHRFQKHLDEQGVQKTITLSVCGPVSVVQYYMGARARVYWYEKTEAQAAHYAIATYRQNCNKIVRGKPLMSVGRQGVLFAEIKQIR